MHFNSKFYNFKIYMGEVLEDQMCKLNNFALLQRKGIEFLKQTQII